MYTIYNNSSDEGHSFNSFKENFIDICRQHKENDRALAFAFILYDLSDPQYNKVLSDQDYWLALNEISGKYLTVFSIHTAKEKKGRKKDFNNEIDFMNKISLQNNPSNGSNILIQEYFSQNLQPSYPALLFFQVHENLVTDALWISLKENRVEESFNELKKYIKTASDTLKKIKPEYKKNYNEIFNQLELGVKGVEQLKNIKRYLGLYKPVSTLIKAIVPH